MFRTKILRKSTFITLLFFVWFAIGAEFNFAQSEGIENKLNKAVELYNQNDFDGSIRLLKEFVNEISVVAEQKKNVADAFYLLAIIYDKQGEDNNADESLRKVYDNYPAFYKDEEDLDFKDRVDRIKKIITGECYQKVLEIFNGEDTPGINELLRKVFMISPGFVGKDATRDSEAFKNIVVKIKE
jgi:tetratricopeptide (TPR) repeat protein